LFRHGVRGVATQDKSATTIGIALYLKASRLRENSLAIRADHCKFFFHLFCAGNENASYRQVKNELVAVNADVVEISLDLLASHWCTRNCNDGFLRYFFDKGVLMAQAIAR